MLDRAFFIKGGDRHEHVTINQQPHDAADAARLYGEIEEKAKLRLRDFVTAKLAPTEIEATVYRQEYLAGDMATLYYIAFRLNGKPHGIEITVGEYEKFRAGDMAGIFESIILPKLSTALLASIWRLPGATTQMGRSLER